MYDMKTEINESRIHPADRETVVDSRPSRDRLAPRFTPDEDTTEDRLADYLLTCDFVRYVGMDQEWRIRKPIGALAVGAVASRTEIAKHFQA